MATASQLKALRRKYHLGEFRRNRTTKKAKSSTKRYTMAKRRRTGVKRYARRANRALQTTNIWANLIGVGGYIAYEAILAPKIPLNEDLKSGAEIVAGLYLSKNKGMLGNIGKAAVVINTYKLMNKYVAPTIYGAVGSAMGSSQDSQTTAFQ